jgi:hypothetical protein
MHHVPASAAVEVVVAGAATQPVGAGEAVQPVVPAGAGEQVEPGGAEQFVVVALAAQVHRSGASEVRDGELTVVEAEKV